LPYRYFIGTHNWHGPKHFGSRAFLISSALSDLPGLKVCRQRKWAPVMKFTQRLER
jgi:hypothetical protein